MSDNSPLNERFKSLQKLFKDIPAGTPIDSVLPQISNYLINAELTGDIYFDFPYFTAKVVKESASSVDEGEISRINAIRKFMSVIFSWGIYPHLPKSLHIKFLNDPHWIDNTAPPRLLKPDPIMLEAVEAFFNSPGLSVIHTLYLQNAICIFYYLEPDKLPEILENQSTETIIASIIALFPTGLNLTSLLIQTIRERMDSFAAIEQTAFPPLLCARAISAVPSNEDPNLYYKTLMPRVFSAIESKKGASIAKCILSHAIKFYPKQLYDNFDLSPILDWPTDQNIAPLLYRLDTYFMTDDLQKVMVEPIPQRIAFIAALTTGAIYNKAISILTKYMKNDDLGVDLIISIAENATLSPIGLDTYTLTNNDNGLFAVIDEERDDDFDIISQMLNNLAEIINLQNTIKLVDYLPTTMNSIHFLSRIIGRYKEIDTDLAIALLLFISKLEEGKEEFGGEIAKLVIEMSPNLTTVPQKVIDSLGDVVPELRLLKIEEDTNSDGKSEFEFDKAQLLQDLISQTVPLRARGLYMLRRGVMKKGHPLRNEDTIKSIFPTIQKQLKHEDTFVFLNAIFCLEAIADVFPHLVIETLTNQYPQKDVAVSLKVGQVLMLCARRTGPGLVHSADGNLCGHFIQAFARGVQHDSSLIQASSLSDLATFVETLSFGCFPWFTDIVATCCSSWQAHKALDVRRSASYATYKIVLTMGKGFEEFSKDDLQNLIDCVKMNRGGEIDEVAHQNAEDCYQTLWDICPMLL